MEVMMKVGMTIMMMMMTGRIIINIMRTMPSKT